MLREVKVDDQKGRLFLTGMPGRYTPFESNSQEIIEQNIDYVVALVSLEEIRKKSPGYAQAIESGRLAFSRVEFAIPDFGVPADRDGYLRLVTQSAEDLRAGKNIALHCGAGIGRTGTLAACILTALGYPVDEALERVEEAGSHPETPEQHALVEWAGAEA